MNLARNSEVRVLLDDVGFCQKWQELFDSCAWGTVFQSCIFVKTWYSFYENQFEPVLLTEYNEEGRLIGLMPLAIETETGRLCAAGCYHAEYQTWLATEENGDAFIERAFETLQQTFPSKKLQLLFLAPNTPLNWLKSKSTLGRQSELRPHLRPLIDVGDGEKFDISLKKKGNKSRIRQLKKIGELKLERLECGEEVEAVFDEIEDCMRLRLSALHNVLPAIDPNRKAFHKALMQIPGMMYASLLRVGDRIASAKFSLRNRNEMLLSITSMSPFLAHQSPSKIHLLMLGKEFAKEEIPVFDLSPGSGYKERFATHSEDAYSLEIFFNKTEMQIHRSRSRAVGTIRQTLERMHLTKNRVFQILERVQHKLKRVKYHTIPRTILKNVAHTIYQKKECRIYSIDLSSVVKSAEVPTMKVDSISDLLKYNPSEGWQMTTSQFHQVCLDRFEEGNHAYTYVENGELLHYGWLVRNQKTSNVYEVQQSFELPENSAVLFDYYTNPSARGRGLYRKSLLQGISDAAKIPGIKQVYIGVMADNGPSRHVIEKLGFVYQKSLFEETKLGKTRRWQTCKSSENNELPTLEDKQVREVRVSS
jgi:CelD/BcsL family acetyltransferase involved in cellulose biosynthesis/RimJ/RimL family protein N-acetyltransferase